MFRFLNIFNYMRNQTHKHKQTITHKTTQHYLQQLKLDGRNGCSINIRQVANSMISTKTATCQPKQQLFSIQEYSNHPNHEVMLKTMTKTGSNIEHEDKQFVKSCDRREKSLIIDNASERLKEKRENQWRSMKKKESYNRKNSQKNNPEATLMNVYSIKQSLNGLQRQNDLNIINSIQELRNAQKFIHNIDSNLDKQQKQYESKLSVNGLFDEMLRDRLLQERQTQFGQMLRLMKDQNVTRMKQKIKNKLSRRHIYHTLKQKSDVWNKIRSRTHEQSQPKQQESPLRTITDATFYHTFRLHCHQPHSNAKNASNRSYKNNNQTNYQNLHQLRIQSKPFSLNKISQDKQGKVMLKIQAFSNYENKRKTNIEIYQQIVANIPVQSKMNKTNEGKFRCKTGENHSEPNVFRELTPWHDQS